MKILVIDAPGLRPALTAPALGGALHELGHCVVVHPWSPVSAWRRRRKVAQIMDAHQPDAVHVLSADPAVADGFAETGVPVVHSVDGAPSRAPVLVAPTQAAARRIAGHRPLVLPHPLDLPEEEEGGFGSFALALFDPADAEARKQAAALAARVPSVPLRTEGEPRDARFCVHFTSNPGAWPWGVAEALCAGRAVVASWGGTASEFVTEGVCGFLSAPGDLASVAAHAEYLWSRPDEAMRMGEEARSEAKGLFGPKPIARELVRAYLRAGFSRLAV
jgi:hypothetical protein